jgi:SAM-dependent methyltransferase
LHLHIDLVPVRLRGKLAAVIANVEQLPLKDASVDVALCVGSVINHGCAKQMISEIARVLMPGALAVLEFDCLDGLHQPGHLSGESAVAIETFFNRQTLTIVEYSRSYIEAELTSAGLVVEYRYSFHIASAFMLRFGIPTDLAAVFIVLDPIMRILNRLRYRGSNLVLVARRK